MDMVTWDEGSGVVEFPDSRRVRGRGLRHPLPAGPAPQFGVYLLGREPEPVEWEHRWVRWPDFRTPRSTDDALAALAEAYERAAAQRVEIACGGGVGRTGTALAAMAVMAGLPVDQPEGADAEQPPVRPGAHTEERHAVGQQPGDVQRVGVLGRAVPPAEGDVGREQRPHVIGAGIVGADDELAHPVQPEDPPYPRRARARRLPSCMAWTRATGIVCPSATRSSGRRCGAGMWAAQGSAPAPEPEPSRSSAVCTVKSPGATSSSSSHPTGKDTGTPGRTRGL